MAIADKLITLKEDFDKVFEAGEKKHISRYATAFKVGDGGTVMSFDCSFEPDFISVSYHGAEAMAADESLLQIQCSKRAFARIAGVYRGIYGSEIKHGSMSAKGLPKYFRYQDGVCTVEIPSLSSFRAEFLANVNYICVAVKYTDKSDRELLEEEIAMLPDTGAPLEYSEVRVLATITEAEWDALIATKPNRTFILG